MGPRGFKGVKGTSGSREKMKQILQNHPNLIPCIVAGVILLGALGDWPYGYYQLLRWITCGAAVWVAFLADDWENKWATVVFVVVAVLFNPLLPIHLSRDLWQPIDLICAVLFVVIGLVLKKPAQDKPEAE
jgi:hypothetical protein